MKQRSQNLKRATAICFGISCFFHFIPGSAFAQESPSSTVAQLDKVLDKMPGGNRLKCLLTDFANIMEPARYGNDSTTVETSNPGLGDYIDSLSAHSPTYQSELNDFYDAVKAATTKSNSKHIPSLNEAAGDKNHSDLPPGWLWTLALKSAQGDPNRAVEMIAACGHDDIDQGHPLVRLSADEQEQKYRERIKAIDSSIADLKSSLHSPKSGDCPEFDKSKVTTYNESIDRDFANTLQSFSHCRDASRGKALLASLTQYRKELSAASFQTVGFECPGEMSADGQANFFLPKSLGEKADISDKLRNRIASTSDLRCPAGQDADPSLCIPAKYYHVYGSALISCELIAEGHNPTDVIEIAKLAGWYYRVLTLSALAQTVGNKTQASPQHWTDEIKKLLDLGKQTKDCVISGSASDASSHIPDPAAMPDALELMRQWTVSGDFGKSIGDLYTNIMINPIGKIDLSSGCHLERPEGWSDARFAKAEAEFNSILTDFAWTVEQHQAGAEFAASVCKPDPKKKSLACSGK